MRRLPLTIQTIYVDLLDKLLDDEVAVQGREQGSFAPKTIKGRVYWYHQRRDAAGEYSQSYLGPETPELLTRIQNHRHLIAADRTRRDMVRALTRGGAVPTVNATMGRVLQGLADSGVFRLRGVLVGTMAYQTYGPMLGVRLTSASVMTEDIDVAQFRSISIAVEDQLPPILTTLKSVDPSFEPIVRPYSNQADAYMTAARLKVEFLTPMQGPVDNAPVSLPALGTASQPLRFLDYLIYQERKAVITYGSGILVNVPDPMRYAWHKLIVAERRRMSEKIPKDLAQAETLFEVLVEDRPDDVRDMWEELAIEGRRNWQQIALDGLRRIKSTIRDRVLKVIDRKID
jgi:hypothetical protein